MSVEKYLSEFVAVQASCPPRKMQAGRLHQKGGLHRLFFHGPVVARACDVRHLQFFAVLLCLALSSNSPAQSPWVQPRKQTMTLPVVSAPDAKPARLLEGVVSFGPPLPLSAVVFSPDGKLLATGGYQEVLLWDLANAKLLKRLGVGQLGEMVQALAFRNNGRELAVAEGTPHGPGAVKLFDIQSGQTAAAFAEPKDVTYCLAFSPDGKLLAGGGVDAVLRVWNVAEKKLVTGIKELGGWIAGAQFSADGKLLLGASADKLAMVWEVGTWKRVVKLEEADNIQAAAFSPDGQFVVLAVAGVNDKALRIWRRADGQLVRAIDLGLAVPLDVVWSAQGNRLYVACADKIVRIYDAGNGGFVASLAGHGNCVYRVALGPDAAKLASASGDGTVKLWHLNERRLLATLVQLTPRSDEWLIAAATGYLATSSPGAVRWKASGLKTPPDKMTALLQNPELVKQAIAGNKVAVPNVP